MPACGANCEKPLRPNKIKSKTKKNLINKIEFSSANILFSSHFLSLVQTEINKIAAKIIQ